MRAYEQIALKTSDIDKRTYDLDLVFSFEPDDNRKRTTWVTDHVHAVHVYLHPQYSRKPVGSAFEVRLAFNYDFIPTKELELIQLVSGESVQLTPGDLGEGLSHLGYHIPDQHDLFSELQWWNTLGYPVAQISMTTDHLNTSKRYLYAFIDTTVKVGAFTKVIRRVAHPKGVDQLVEEFENVNYIRR